MVRGPGCITSRAFRPRRSTPFSIRRRRSPSVKMPSTRPSPSTTAEAPRPLALISRISSLTDGVRRRRAARHRPCASRRSRGSAACGPARRPGCERAKSSALKPRASSRATASASPSASCAVVLAVGARLSGQASFSTPLSSTMSAWRASVDSAPPVIAISGTPRRLSTGRITVSLFALAAVGDGEHQVDRLDHAQVAVAGLGRVHEHGRRAGGGQRGGDLAADVAALAHAHHHHAAAHAQDRARTAWAKLVAGAGLQAQHRRGFDVEGFARQAQRAGPRRRLVRELGAG